MISWLDVNCILFIDCFKDDMITAADTPSDQMAMGAVVTLYEFSLCVSHQNYNDLSLRVLLGARH
jgi:hypothetical protein